jgi:hypothetical protein
MLPSTWNCFVQQRRILMIAMKLSAEVYCVLGYDTKQPDRSLLTFWRNMTPPSSGLKGKPHGLLLV